MHALLRKRRYLMIGTLLVALLISIVPWGAAVTSRECYSAYERCMQFYAWTGPFAYPYCTNGYIFCMLFIV